MRDYNKCVNWHSQGCLYVSGGCEECKLYSENDHIQRFMSYHWVTDLVRCKDCVHWLDLQDSTGEWVDWCRFNGSGFGQNDYCSKGKRKDKA